MQDFLCARIYLSYTCRAIGHELMHIHVTATYSLKNLTASLQRPLLSSYLSVKGVWWQPALACCFCWKLKWVVFSHAGNHVTLPPLLELLIAFGLNPSPSCLHVECPYCPCIRCWSSWWMSQKDRTDTLTCYLVGALEKPVGREVMHINKEGGSLSSQMHKQGSFLPAEGTRNQAIENVVWFKQTDPTFKKLRYFFSSLFSSCIACSFLSFVGRGTHMIDDLPQQLTLLLISLQSRPLSFSRAQQWDVYS